MFQHRIIYIKMVIDILGYQDKRWTACLGRGNVSRQEKQDRKRWEQMGATYIQKWTNI